MRNIRLIVEYDGTGYAGWHIQKDAPTIQGELIRVIRGLTGEEDLMVTGASRTDAGVHAIGQTANFLTSCDIPPEGILSALNNTLPGDIVIREAAEVPVGFSAQRDSTFKFYVYRVLNRSIPSALLGRYVWFVDRPLDLALMREGALHFTGLKDFSSR
jgi:tRNA pseudouridine38-40 synthase